MLDVLCYGILGWFILCFLYSVFSGEFFKGYDPNSPQGYDNRIPIEVIRKNLAKRDLAQKKLAEKKLAIK